MPTYIYALSDPDTQEVHYIGQTYTLRSRLANHAHGAGSGNYLQVSWQISLKERKLLPVMTVLETIPGGCRPPWLPNIRERYWIEKYAAAGAMLANIMHNPTFANPATREHLKRFFGDMVDITALVGHRLNTAHPSFRKRGQVDH